MAFMISPSVVRGGRCPAEGTIVRNCHSDATAFSAGRAMNSCSLWMAHVQQQLARSDQAIAERHLASPNQELWWSLSAQSVYPGAALRPPPWSGNCTAPTKPRSPADAPTRVGAAPLKPVG